MLQLITPVMGSPVLPDPRTSPMGPASEHAQPTPAPSWWSWRKSSTLTGTCAGQGGSRWPPCWTCLKGRSRYGSRTGGWSSRRSRSRRESPTKAAWISPRDSTEVTCLWRHVTRAVTVSVMGRRRIWWRVPRCACCHLPPPTAGTCNTTTCNNSSNNICNHSDHHSNRDNIIYSSKSQLWVKNNKHLKSKVLILIMLTCSRWIMCPWRTVWGLWTGQWLIDKLMDQWWTVLQTPSSSSNRCNSSSSITQGWVWTLCNPRQWGNPHPHYPIGRHPLVG